ncbi:similar to Saccharomyces cerevisiae YDL091C UBX3 UBX (ubiquitin regulatory X) domain- containing protein that interacts with Cdc48p [Maudiozyma barnettii]|uniref:Similar to Saccharomyces cerevisiae YDL091C UBX3 UBX (Ubiquitin regulatory X) domain- containing protein that interacts with Cdc48p n=1 Tax=Maudiozyma barnettii TaxID=61262 RepID=A0A8H2VKQ7_9SACH|nr:Ubx3p [Kazachstania barnettii]CAB4257085.1 similar to Saccharomyces cerevisiae YDL091C UBX3 UBX (ubiquitin regulatory X) domain- containing protein that interacts with Cdc48p [Kazachstania barnettii]CAD1779456.1 similar to Saccharomyces cerevisiae YDL091C UBX3 UBX (ubiquitin regulatory X) domain- containing protein that interacts with Cdc48p [Kazachstania barnettii]
MSVLGYRDTQDNVPGGFPDVSVANQLNSQNEDSQIPSHNGLQDITQYKISLNKILYMFFQIPLLLLSLLLTFTVFIITTSNKFLKVTNFYDSSHKQIDSKSNLFELLNTLSMESHSASTTEDISRYNFGSIYNSSNSIISGDNLQSSYTELLDACTKQYKFGFIYLHDKLKDDSMCFVDNILCTDQFINMVKKHQGLIWFGDITKAEGLQVANNWKVRHFPFVGVIMMKRSNKVELIAKAEGSLINYSPNKFERVLKKNQETLIQLIQQQQNIEMQRLIREQQDSRFRSSLRRDQERNHELEAARLREQQEAELHAQQAQEVIHQEELLKRWLVCRLHRLHPEPSTGDNVSKVAIKLGNGERVIRKFDASLPIEEIYAYVELRSKGILSLQYNDISDTIPPENYIHNYGFKLISPVPRVELQPETIIEESTAVFPSGNIIVEDLD